LNYVLRNAFLGYSSGYGTGFGSGSNIRPNKKVKKSKMGGQLSGNAAPDSKRHDFVQILLLFENYFKYCLDPELEQVPEPGPKSEPKLFQSWNWNGNRKNHYRYVSTTLQ
jgi:hypothetical protein